MKFSLRISILLVTLLFAITSCSKDPVTPTQPRNVQFILYTDKDFSSDNNNIIFKLSIQNSTNQTLWDSLLAPMKIKDIPNFANKLVYEKQVPGNNASTLKVGFYYTIENVGNSWYVDTFKLGAPLKIIEYNFQ